MNRTSKVTEDDLEGSDKEDNSEEKTPEKRIAIKGMKLLDGSKTMLSKTGSFERGRDKSKMDKEEEEEQEFDDTDVEIKKAGIDLTERMGEALGLLNMDLEDKEEVYNTPDASTVDPFENNEGEVFIKADFSKYLDENNLKPKDYESDILKVSFGEFNAAHTQKYKDPANFLQVL